MTEQENERDLDPRDWISCHGVKFLQEALWELGLDEEPKETLMEVLETVHRRTKLYVFDTGSARRYVNDCGEVDFLYSQFNASARQERIKARRIRKLEAMDTDDSLPWE